MAVEKRSSAPRKSPQQQRSREMVAKIVAAAAWLLRATDPESITTNLIATKAGVSKGSIYQYFSDKDEILVAAVEVLATEETPAIEQMLRGFTLAEPGTAIDASIDLLIDFTIANRRLIRYINARPERLRAFESKSGLTAVLLAMTTVHMSAYRDHYRHELPARSLAWLFFNMAEATTLRYIESGDPIPLAELRSGLKFAMVGLLGGRPSESTAAPSLA